MAVYATEADVEFVMGATFDSDSEPTSAQVATALKWATSYLEEQTRHAWQVKTVTTEYHDITAAVTPRFIGYGVEIPIKLNHRAVRALSSEDGDKVEYWNGASYTDLLATGTEDRAQDFWLDYTSGILYLRSWIPAHWSAGIRVSYRYGETTILSDIAMACAKLAAIEIVRGQNRVEVLPEGTLRVGWLEKIESWQKDIEAVIRRHREHHPGTM